MGLTLLFAALVLVVLASSHLSQARRLNEPITWAANLTLAGYWYPPQFGQAGVCAPIGIKVPFNAFVITINGSLHAAFALQAYFSGDWSPNARIYLYTGVLQPSVPCANISSEVLYALERWEMLVALTPGTHTIVTTTVPFNATSPVRSGLFTAALIPANAAGSVTNSTAFWRPPVLHYPLNCQQTEAQLVPFLHYSFVSPVSGVHAFNVYGSGQPTTVNTSVWVFNGNFTIENGTVTNPCEATFITGMHAPLLVTTAYVNLTQGESYTVAAQFVDSSATVLFWGVSIVGADLRNSNNTQPIFAGVPSFARGEEVFVCAPTGVTSKYALLSFTAADLIYAFDFRFAFSNLTILAIYEGVQTPSTGCRNFLAGIRAFDVYTPHRWAPLVVPLVAGKNFTMIISSGDGDGGYFDLIGMAGHNREHAFFAPDAAGQQWLA